MSRRVLAALLPGLLALALAPAAGAVTFAGQVIDGPDAALTSAGSLGVARDGTGALAYAKSGRVYVAALSGGTWSSPVAIDGGVPSNAADVHVSAADGGAVVVAWTAGGRVWTSYRAPFAPAFGTPQAVYSGTADNLSIDLSVNLKAFLAFHAGGDVRVARLYNGSWTLLSQALDASSADAGAGTGRPDVAVASDGTAIVVWGEGGTVFARRVRGTDVSTVVVQASLPSLGGQAAAGADLPVVDTGDDDSFAVVAFRQSFRQDVSTVPHVIARRLRGSAFDDPIAVDDLGVPTSVSGGSPAVSMAGNNHGYVVASRSDGQVWTSLVDAPADIQQPSRADLATGGASPPATVAVAEHTWAYVVSRRSGRVVIRPQKTNSDKSYGFEQVVSGDELGSVDATAGLRAAADDPGDLVVAFVQGSGSDRRLVVGGVDFPPSRPTELGPLKWLRTDRPRLVWTASNERWGARYAVSVDGVSVGTTSSDAFRVPADVADGVHRYQVTVSDLRGQSATSRVGTFKVDTRAPKARLALGGSRVRGGLVRARARGSDGPRSDSGGGGAPTSTRATGSGVRSMRINWGDGSRTVTVREGRRPRHRYRKAGRYKVALTVRDLAGNHTRKVKRVRIRRAAASSHSKR
jgi:hypothetical protein